MTVRESLERLEEQYLSPVRVFEQQDPGAGTGRSLCAISGRNISETGTGILHCKAFRRLKHKTQVFLAPEGDHYRTRLTHTLEVSQIARTIAKSLRLNESLAEAIALGHDLGHTPFGHSGEAVLNRIYEGGFTHYEQSIRVVEVLEKNGRGLNLTWEVRDGILNHRTAGTSIDPGGLYRPACPIRSLISITILMMPSGQELFVEEDLPREYTDVLGQISAGSAE